MKTKRTITATGHELPDLKEVTILLFGTWETTKYGRQLKVSRHEVVLPSSRKGIGNYLKSLKVGIGWAKSDAMFNTFGESLWDVIENAPEKLLEVPGISATIVEKLSDALNKTRKAREILRLFAGSTKELTVKNAESLLAHFAASKEDAVDVIMHNTYRLCDVNGFGFKTVDKMALSLGQAPNASERILAAVECVFEEAAAEGHVCLPKELSAQRLVRLLNRGFRPPVVTENEAKTALNTAVKSGKIKMAAGMLYSTFRYEQEVSIAEEIRRLDTGNDPITGVEAFIADFETENSITLAASQKKAIANCFAHRVNVITGGPGVGKTTIIKAVLYCHDKIFGSSSNPMLLAPTGRAARRMTEATGHTASTIHQAIGYKGDSDEMQEAKSKETTVTELEGNLFIADEFSMADLFVTSALLKAIPSGATVIFVGDPDQLPAVGCGNVLHEFIRSETICISKLDVIFRQAKENPIVANALRINKGDTNIIFANTFKMFETQSAEETFRKACSLYIGCVKAYGLDKVTLLNPIRNRDKSEVNVYDLNLALQRTLNPVAPNAPSIKGKDGITFHIGDKIMQTKNTRIARNGDTGYILDIVRRPDPADASQLILCAVIEFNADGNLHEYPTKEMQFIDLAYCTTVHKSQGAEYETVIMVVSSSHSAMLKRNLVYTGITRAQKNVAIVGSKEALSTAIRNDNAEMRYTLLGDRLHAKLKKYQAA